jgi:hypothetical protein
MNPNPAVMKSIDKLGYRVTVGDVAANAGLALNLAQQELIALASETQGHLQVAETGDIVYLFPQNFRTILRNKYWQLRWQKWLSKIWQIIFYLIRISFGIILVSSIIIMLLAIAILVIAISSSKGDDNNDSRGGGNLIFLPNFWFSPDFFWIFTPNYQQKRYQRQQETNQLNKMNFLESIYSFLFGDGNPNPNLEERRWQQIGAVIKNNNGAVIAEQIAPYLDNINIYNERDEDYMLPILTRFNGYPQVSNQGEIIYYFPELQVTAERRSESKVPDYLRENNWQFSLASSGQKIFAFFLGGLNFVLALVLGSMLTPELAQQVGSDFIFLVESIYEFLLVYAVAYLAIPLIRYLWLQGRNDKINQRNFQRETRAKYLEENKPQLLPKINYARQFAQEKIIEQKDLAYSTEKDLLDQQIEQADKIDQEWMRRLNQGSS